VGQAEGSPEAPHDRLVAPGPLGDLRQGERSRAGAHHAVTGDREQAPAAIGLDQLVEGAALVDEEGEELDPGGASRSVRREQAGVDEPVPLGCFHGGSEACRTARSSGDDARGRPS